MILSDGVVVNADWGARPVWEADFLVVVGGPAINEPPPAARLLRRSGDTVPSSNCPT